MKILIIILILGTLNTEAKLIQIRSMDETNKLDIFDISLTPDLNTNHPKLTQEQLEQLLLLRLGSREDIEDVMKSICGRRNEYGADSDLYTCAIRTVTSFISCMHMETDGLTETDRNGPFIKCLSQATNVFVKCLIFKQTSVGPSYDHDDDIQNT